MDISCIDDLLYEMATFYQENQYYNDDHLLKLHECIKDPSSLINTCKTSTRDSQKFYLIRLYESKSYKIMFSHSEVQ
jgi:hypothetical protein